MSEYIPRASRSSKEVERLRTRDRLREVESPRPTEQIARRNADRLVRNEKQKAEDPEGVLAQRREAQKSYRNRWRDAAYAAYGGVCACCGESDPRFLTIDHVHGLRGEKRVWTGTLYKMLRDLCYPADYALLCFNCNLGRARNGGVCPHEDVLEATG